MFCYPVGIRKNKAYPFINQPFMSISKHPRAHLTNHVSIEEIIRNIYFLPQEIQQQILLNILPPMLNELSLCMLPPIITENNPIVLQNQKIKSIAYSPDGKHIAIGSNESTRYGPVTVEKHRVLIWSIAQNTLHELEGKPHTQHVNSVAYSPDGKYIASASGDSVKIWDTYYKELITTLEKGGANSVAYYPNTKRKYIALGLNTSVRTWDYSGTSLRGYKELNLKLNNNWPNVYSVTYSPNGQYIAAGSANGTIQILDADLKAIVSILTGNTDIIYSVAYSPNGRYIASGSADGLIKIFDTSSNDTPVKTLEGHTRSVNSVAYSPDGRYIASGSNDGGVKIWDTNSNILSSTLIGHKAPVHSIAYSPDGHYIASGSSDGTVRIWHLVSTNSLIDNIRTNKYRLSSGQLLLLYVLFQFYGEQQDLGKKNPGKYPKNINLASIKQALEKKYGQNIPWIIDLPFNYSTLPQEIRDIIRSCFRVIDNEI